MNDTHGVEGKPWIGFDLDGTLAKYDKWEGIDHIGEPVKHMVDLIRKVHAEGKVVKILTARVAPRANAECNREKCAPPDYVSNADFSGFSDDAKTWIENMYLCLDTWGAREFVIDWCLKNLGFLPEITHEKDHLMIELYDDRVKQVIPNEGLLVEDRYHEAVSLLKEMHSNNGWLLARVESKRNGFLAGILLGCLINMFVWSCVGVYSMYFKTKTPTRERVEKLVESAQAVLECDFSEVK